MTTASNKSVGLTSIGGGLLFLFVFAWVIILAGPDPEGLEAPIARFPEIKNVRIVENGLYLAALALWVPLYLALYQRLKVGAALGILGLGVLAAGAIPHVATARLSDLYHAPAATAQDKATLVLVWQATQGVFDALLLTGLLLMAAAVVLLGLAMRADPGFGKAMAWSSTLLGAAALAAGIAMLIDPASPVAALGFFALIGFHFVAGWKVASTVATVALA